MMKVPGEIPIIEKRQRPSSGQLRPSSAGKVVPSKSVSAKKDASIVLSYLKKNMYDDTRKYGLGYSEFRYIARTLYCRSQHVSVESSSLLHHSIYL